MTSIFEELGNSFEGSSVVQESVKCEDCGTG